MSASEVACRSCGRQELVRVLSLGTTPLANSLLLEGQLAAAEPRFPLNLSFCTGCSLVQLEHSVPPDQLFSDYVYFSSFSDTMVRHAAALAGELISGRGLGPDSLIVEAASNDGYLLQHYMKAGVRVLGIEPAANVAQVARERGVATRCEFFGEDFARQLAAEGLRADVFHGHNVLAHVPDLNGFVEGIRLVLKDDGVGIIEVPYLKEMLDHCEFDTIYHEHLFYFSLTALKRLFERHGLKIVDVQRISIHGGSLRLTVARETSPAVPSLRVEDLLREEGNWQVDDLAAYQGFASKVERLKSSLCSALAALRAEGKRIAAYGASAKGSTLLNYCGIGAETLDFVVDRSTVKQGRYTPGTHLAISPPERLLQEMPDYVLLLTWNFADEIIQQQAEYLKRGGNFILPLPEVRVVGHEISDDRATGCAPDRAGEAGGQPGLLRPDLVPG